MDDVHATSQHIYHIATGLHSKIPVCCIRAFLDDTVVHNAGDHGWKGYGPCQECFWRGNKVDIHFCDESCDFLWQLADFVYKKSELIQTRSWVY